MAAQPPSLCGAVAPRLAPETVRAPAELLPLSQAATPSVGERLKAELLAAGAVTAEQMTVAEGQARREGVDLSRALVDLSLATYETLGGCLSRMTSLPYAPLLERMPPYDARRLLSFECASSWLAMPVAYDRAANQLTLAIHDPAQIEPIRRIFRFFVRSQAVQFAVASRPEIEKAFAKHFGGRSGHSRQWLFRPLTARPAGRSLPSPARRPAGAGEWKIGMRSWTPPPYDKMSHALLDAVALLVTRELGDAPAKLAEVRARVRYCQLLAVRVSLSPAEVDGATILAWISDFEAWRHLGAPYALDSSLERGGSAATERIEGQVVGLVKAYQTMKRECPREAEDMAATRRYLQARWHGADSREDVLEEFLQLLVDEDFLTRIERGAGRILVVDAEELSEPVLLPPLQGEGYEVEAVPSVHAAWEKLKMFSPHLIIANAVLPDMDGAKFCRELKAVAGTSRIPLVIVGKGEKGAATRFLRAGADEFLLKPVDLQVLALKISRLLASSVAHAHAAGFKGSLRDMNFTDLIQVAGAGDKRMEIIFEREGQKGCVCLAEGHVVHAAVDGLEGEEAFYAAMRWSDGEFSARRAESLERQTMRVPIMPLLMEGARRCDEDVPVGRAS